jgi:cell pole-organizing protein PopZ
MQIRCSAANQDVVGESIMAQSSSVAREPSMEEILASIRRIIEESDTTREDVVPTPVNSDVPAPAAATQTRPQSYDTAEDEPELPPREGIAVSHPAPQSYEAPLGRSFSPLQSKLVEREPAATVQVAQPEILEATTTVVHETVDYHVQDAETFEVPEAVIEAPEPQLEPVIEPEAKAEEQPFAVQTEQVVPAYETSESSIGDEVSLDLERALEPILSEATERQVSAAFGDLSFAVQNEQRRSFDEIAQEIMRPLLQDWLDNNLPNLVERLVREEIERVARGAKR